MNPNWGIGQFLAYQRKLFGIASQADFAERLGISRFHLANIESGRTPLRMDIAWKACRELEIHPGFLISRGRVYQAPFDVLDGEAVAKADVLIRANRNARFIEFWPALYALLFESSEMSQAPSPKKDEVTLDKPPAIADDSVVKNEIRSLPELLIELRNLTKVRGSKVALANEMKVKRQAVDQWLSGATKPTAEMTFKLISWVEKQPKRTK
jgi:transcriptional regulator with XRE-family HTH domain